MRCPHCGQEHPDSITFCPNTGQKIVATQFCSNCGAEVQPSWKVCPKCGTPVGNVQTAVSVQRQKNGGKYETINRASMSQSRSTRSKVIIVGIISLILLVS